MDTRSHRPEPLDPILLARLRAHVAALEAGAARARRHGNCIMAPQPALPARLRRDPQQD